MTDRPDFKGELLTQVPSLIAQARTLCGRTALADDLVQDTLVRAWAHRDGYTIGTNMRAWLFAILRNLFCSHLRRNKVEVEDIGGEYVQSLANPPEQQSRLELKELMRVLPQLPEEQRAALVLVGAGGSSYDEAAAICGCATGTVKSRVSRARRTLLRALEQPQNSVATRDSGADGEAAFVRHPQRRSLTIGNWRPPKPPQRPAHIERARQVRARNGR